MAENRDDLIEEINLDLSDFEVARSEFFADIREPAFVFNNGKVGVNTACVRRLPDVEYVQILINRKKKKLALRACMEEDLFSIPWGKTRDGKRTPRQITGRMFFMKVCDMMDWNPQHRYRILGKLVRANGELIFLFDLTAAKTFERTLTEDGKRKCSRTPVMPAEWKNQFGIPFAEHKKALQVNMFDGYTVFSLKEEPEKPEEQKETEETEEPKEPEVPEKPKEAEAPEPEGGKRNERQD